MYPYHNLIKQRIKNGELEGYEYVENYPGIGECLLLHFCTPPFIRPIRPHKYHEYSAILDAWERNHKSHDSGEKKSDF